MSTRQMATSNETIARLRFFDLSVMVERQGSREERCWAKVTRKIPDFSKDERPSWRGALAAVGRIWWEGRNDWVLVAAFEDVPDRLIT